MALSLYERALDFLVTLAVRYAHKVDAEVLNVFCRFARITFRDVDKEEDRKIRWETKVFLKVLCLKARYEGAEVDVREHREDSETTYEVLLKRGFTYSLFRVRFRKRNRNLEVTLEPVELEISPKLPL